MAHPWHHAVSSSRKFGGKPEEYLKIHNFFDESKAITADFRHRALRHHAEGIFMAECIFGVTITLENGKRIPVRWIGEQHVTEDLGFIPSFADWVKAIKPEPWMGRARKLEAELEREDHESTPADQRKPHGGSSERAPSHPRPGDRTGDGDPEAAHRHDAQPHARPPADE